LVDKKIHHLEFGFTNAKKMSLFFLNTGKYLVYQRYFWWDQPSETIQNTCLTFQRRYVCIVSGK
jgi:hypothetical protein